MGSARVGQLLSASDRAAVDALLAEVERASGRPPLSDHLRLDYAAGGGPGFTAALVEDDRGLVGYGQASLAHDSSSIEVVLRPDADAGVEADLLRSLRRSVSGPLFWWVHGADDTHDAIAAELGMSADRRLLQLRRELPIGADAGVSTRPFVVGSDEEAWLAVNNRAFAWHPEQGGWDLDTLQTREAESWFDPDGFLLHERDGRLAAFCWTKLHPATTLDPALGEIYVIAVDPDFVGLGLGRSLTLAGLESIAAHGVTTGMLFVDESNAAALGLYVKLGFHTHRVDVAFRSDG